MTPVSRDMALAPDALPATARSARLRRWSLSWMAALACLVVAITVTLLHHEHQLHGLQTNLQRDAKSLTDQVKSLSTDGRVMGSVILLGLVNPDVNALLAGQREPDDPSLIAAFRAVLGEFRADSVMVLDRSGRTRAHVALDSPGHRLGRDLSALPYVQRALAGNANLYPALGDNAADRGIYMAAPARATADPEAEVSGVVVIKIRAERVDAILTQYPHAALLISPDGVVFGGNRPQWLLQLTRPLSAEQHAHLVREAQFGDFFRQGSAPQSVPLNFTGDGARLGDARLTTAEEALDWPVTGPGPGWRLLLLRERAPREEWLLSGAMGAAVLVLLLLCSAFGLQYLTRAERRAQERRAIWVRMRGMLEAMPHGVATLDEAGCVLYANSALERLAGVSMQTLVGRPLTQLLAMQASPEQLLAQCREAPDQMVDTQLHTQSGEAVPVALAVASFDDGGERHLVASLHNIAARLRAQDAVARELAFQQRLIDTLPSPLFLKDMHGRFTTMNRAFEEAFGVRREAAAGQTLLQLGSLDAATREQVHARDLAIIQGGGLHQALLSQQWADGRLHQVLFWGQGLLDAEGQPAGMVGVLLDISEQVAAREMLRQRERELDLLLQSAPGAVIVTHENGQVLFYNQHALQMFRIDADTLKAQGMRTRYVDQAQRKAIRDALIRDGLASADEVEMLRGDGSRFWVRLSFSRGNFGPSSNAVFGWSVDITERRQADEVMRAAKEAAEAAAEAKSGFLANMSHEIRTPMNAIIGLAHLALQTPLSAQQKDYVQKVLGAARSLLGIVNDILDFSKIEAGNVVMVQVDFDLDTLLAPLAIETGEKAGDKQLELVFDIGPQVPRHLHGDGGRLAQVLNNLLSNALKFTAQGEIVLHCRHRVLEARGVVLDFSVRDTGIGMTPAQMARMFTPFSQADESITRKVGGTGLGLSICKRLIEAAGGHISVESAPGQGAAFNFSWPCALASAGQHPVTCPKVLQGARALVVEGHPTAAEVLTSALVNMGLVVDRAADADAALALLQASAAPHALVFANLHMPSVDGLALTRRLKADAVSAAAPPAVVLLATKGDDALRRAAGQSGACDVLLKPVTHTALAATLARVSVGAVDTEARAPAPDVLPRLDGMRVLLAQAHEDEQQLAIQLISATGADVQVVGDGQACVEQLLAAGANAFAVLLLDLQLPFMDAHQTAAAIRAQPQFDTLPIIAMTAHARPDERQRCLDGGMNDYVAKPINAASMYAILAQWGGALQMPSSLATHASAGDVSDWALRLKRAVPGLNVASAMRRVLGNQSLYAQSLHRYVQEQADADGQLAEWLARGDLRQAQLFVRTLRRVSVHVGADGVAAQAARLDDAMRAQAATEQLQRCAADLRSTLGPVLQGLRDFFADAALAEAAPVPARAPASTRLTDVRARAELARLCAMLASMDSEAKDQVERLEPWLRQWLTAHEMLTLLRDVRQYDLDEALALLHRAPGLASWHAREDRRVTVSDRRVS